MIALKISIGYELVYEFPKPTPVILVLAVHFSRAADVIVPDNMITEPYVTVSPYRDIYGNLCSRLLAPMGLIRLSASGVVRDSGLVDCYEPSAYQHAVEDLPNDTLIYLVGSQYCETQHLSDIAWTLFEHSEPGWSRVQSICDFVHHHIQFGLLC